MKLQLVSFALCPFVQRSVITLKHKKAPFELTFIEDLENPPAWFERVSPMGKVPVLLVHGKTQEPVAIFESAVINEYIDETVGTPLSVSDPLQKALERAWVEFGSELIGTQYQVYTASDQKDLEAAQVEFFEGLTRLESVIRGPYFRGGEFSLVDTAFAPVFMRAFLFPELKSDGRWAKMPKVRAWAETLLGLPEVKESVLPDFEQKMFEYIKKRGSLLARD